MTQAARDGAAPAGNRQIVWLGLGLVVWIAALRWPFFLYEPTGPDEGLYLAAAVRMLAGARLYTDVWDNKPVGIYLVYTAIAATLGHSRTAVNLASALAVLASSLLLYLIGRDATGRQQPGLIAAFVLPAYMLDLGADGANAETFMMVLQSLSVWLLVRHCRAAQPVGRHLRAAFVFGLLQGVLLQLKFTSVFETAAIGLALAGIVWWQHRSVVALVKLAVAFVVGYPLCTLVVFGYFAATGGIGDMVFATLVSPRLYVVAPFGLADPMRAIELTIRRSSYFVVLILFALWFVFDRLRRGRDKTSIGGEPLALLGAWVIGAVLNATSPGYFRYFYFIALAAPLSLLGALAIDRLAMWKPQWGRLGTLAGVAVLVAYPLAQHILKEPQRLLDPDSYIAPRTADLVRSLAPAGSLVFITDVNPLVYPLADVIPATRYPQANAHVFDLPERFGVDTKAELQRVFARSPLLVIAAPARLEPGSPYSGLLRDYLDHDYQRISVPDRWLDGQIVVFRRRQQGAGLQ
jgi:4-amino-4-deoxy-L-arabinose transferase-like glycosyltransferase